jgi:hypothetical protein
MSTLLVLLLIAAAWSAWRWWRLTRCTTCMPRCPNAHRYEIQGNAIMLTITAAFAVMIGIEILL